MGRIKHSKMIKNTKKELLDIVKYPDKSLNRTDNEYVEGFTGDWLKQLAINMIYTMKAVRGVGLAAPQVGLPLRLTVALIDNIPVVLVNPELTGHPEERTVSIEEGCLSCPNESVRIPRYAWIRVDYDDIHGRRKWLHLDGLNATIVQHEMDHLDGKLIVDYKKEAQA